MQSAAVQCSYTVAKSLLITFFFSAPHCFQVDTQKFLIRDKDTKVSIVVAINVSYSGLSTYTCTINVFRLTGSYGLSFVYCILFLYIGCYHCQCKINHNPVIDSPTVIEIIFINRHYPIACYQYLCISFKFSLDILTKLV